jgi:two-component system, cell cycle sensor histidine kinase and response regulator CckA
MLRVLHVEDDDLEALLLQTTLDETGLDSHLTRVTSLDEARALMQVQQFDLYIVDRDLPDGMGTDLIREARKAGATAPMIVMTGADEAAVDEEALEAGANDFFPKSDLNASRLRRTVRYAMKAHNLSERLREHARALEADSLLVVAEDGRVLFATLAAEELFGRTMADMAGVALGVDFSTENTLLEVNRPDGTSRQAVVRTVSSTWAGHAARLVWLRDVTAEPERDAAATERSAVSRLAAGIAHDFNNLLGGVMGHLELALLMKAKPAKSGRHIENALRTATRAADLTAQLLAFARRAQPELVPTDLTDWLRTLRPALHGMVQEPGSLVLDLPSEPVWVSVDPAGLEQALLNLVGNAGDALEGAGTVHVSVAGADPVVLTVQDDGCGMEPGVLASALDPFFTTKPVGAGTGLGLPLAHKLVETMGGSVEITSQVGQGTTVLIALAAGEAATETEPGPRPPPVSQTRRTGSVLVVDDEAPIRAVISAALESSGYRVVVAASPSEALRCFERDGPFDLVLTDVAMQEMDGLELAARMLKEKPDQPVALMSGYGHRAAAALDRRSELPILPKPFLIRDVLAFVNAHIQ